MQGLFLVIILILVIIQPVKTGWTNVRYTINQSNLRYVAVYIVTQNILATDNGI